MCLHRGEMKDLSVNIHLGDFNPLREYLIEFKELRFEFVDNPLLFRQRFEFELVLAQGRHPEVVLRPFARIGDNCLVLHRYQPIAGKTVRDQLIHDTLDLPGLRRTGREILGPGEIELYDQIIILRDVFLVVCHVEQSGIVLNKDERFILWEHLVFNKDLCIKISPDIIDKLKHAYNITGKDYLIQKEKLAQVGFTIDEQVMYIENLLELIGLVKDFPKFVIISGHGSISDNNPFESALDCGACGGSISLPNARAICMIANKEEIREKLKSKGIDIPADVRFIPSMHVTTTDEITFHDTDSLSSEDLKLFSEVERDFKKASFQAREERALNLPNTNEQKDLFIKTMDWSEPRPEWGLAGTMGVFAGPRDSCKHMPFRNRLFLHSYDSTLDNENADLLTRLFNGPLVVGEWISLEHYFSTTDNKVYGAGSKVYHNVVSKIGVYNGNYSDLKIGLPTQSVLLEGEAYHEPVRLLTYMEAPLDTVAKAVENSIAKEFILNEWIRPIIIDKAAKKVYSYEFGEFKVIKELE